MAETQTFLHASFVIRDVDQARAFYSGLLGWREDPRSDLGFPADSSFLPDPQRSPMGRDSHIAVRVSNFDAIVPEGEARGGRVRHSEMGGKRRGFIRDPDGNMVELWEP